MSERNSGTTGEAGQANGAIDPADALGSFGGNSNGELRDSAGELFDGSIHSDPGSFNKDGTFRRKRGRRTNTGTSYKKAHSDIKQSAEMLTKGLMIFHTMLAAATKTPELVLSQEEASGISESGLTLLELYDIKPDPKIEAMVTFIGALGLTYAPRIVAIRARNAQAKKAASEGSAEVFDADGIPMGTTEFQFGDHRQTPN